MNWVPHSKIAFFAILESNRRKAAVRNLLQVLFSGKDPARLRRKGKGLSLKSLGRCFAGFGAAGVLARRIHHVADNLRSLAGLIRLHCLDLPTSHPPIQWSNTRIF